MVGNMSADPATPHEIITDRFADAGLAEGRFVSVEDGEKACYDHDTKYDRATLVPGTNYGVYSAEQDRFLILDVDEYEGNEGDVPLIALDALPDTLEIMSPHVPTRGPGGHRLYKLGGELDVLNDSDLIEDIRDAGGELTPAALFSDRFGTKNPVPSWGEVITKNKYCVGAGSQLHGCNKEWCDTCRTAEGGRYEIQEDRPIATVDPERLVNALDADPDINKSQRNTDAATQTLDAVSDSASGETSRSAGGYDELTEAQVESMLEALPGRQHFDEWIKTGYAVFDWDDGATGKRLFTDWSRTNPKWEQNESQKQIDYIWNNGQPGTGSGKASVGTLIHKATQNGWEPENTSPEPQTLGAEPGGQTDESGTDGTESDGESDDDSPAVTWDDIHKGYQAATKADDRLAPRYDARQLLTHEDHWRNVEETDHLWVFEHDSGLFVPRGEQVVRNRLVDNLKEQFRSHEVNEICTGVKGEPNHQISEDELGGPAEHIACENGVLKLDSHPPELLDHHPRFGFISALETEYDPDAECPRFEQFLRETIPEPSDRLKLQEFAGYVLMHWALPYHKAMFLVGPTASGKSTFLDTIRAMIGDSAGCSLTPQQMTEEQFSAAELYESWVNIRNDIPAQTIQNTGQFKEIIAGDPIKAEEKYQDPFMFSPDTKHMFSGNELPEADESDNSDAFYRRIMLVAFPETIPRPQRESDLDEQLQSELPGVLNWALEGLDRLRDSDGFTGDRPPGQTEITWQKWSNSIKRFVSEGLEESGGNDIPKADVHGAYQAYCESEGIPARSQHKFSRWVKNNTGFEDGRAHIGGSSREHRKRVFRHCGLTEVGREYLERFKDGDSED
jgi:P4 family phage/plasmid primase-like protien